MEYIVLYGMVFAFGIVIGSFLNVCICRIPRHENLVTERSHCVSCGNVLKWYELIPVVSFAVQGGKCRHCGEPVSWQYPLVELLNGCLYVWVFWANGFRPDSILFVLCVSALIVLSVIDYRTYEIPLGCNVTIGLLGLVRLMTDWKHGTSYVIGFFAVSLFLLIIWAVTKGRGMGGGDIKLMAAAGLLLGWQKILIALAVASIAGSVIHIGLMKLRNRDRVLAFGPYLAFGIFMAMLYGDGIMQWYFR